MHKRLIIKLSYFNFLLILITSCKKDNAVSFDYAKYYTVKPDIENCLPGAISENSKIAALNRINYIRSLHKLPPLTYNAADDEMVQRSALISAANATLDHNPVSTAECFTPLGASASSKSNLGIGLSSVMLNVSDESNIDNWLTEENSETIGHRRWLLDPFLKYVAYGRVDGKPKKSAYSFVSAASLKVINDEQADIANLNIDYVAYPYENYPTGLFPKNLFLSFSVLYDKRYAFLNSFPDFKDATIAVTTTDAGQALQVNAISFDNEGAGLPNSIQWKVNDLKDNTSYTVNIKNVYIDGLLHTYQYEFKLIK